MIKSHTDTLKRHCKKQCKLVYYTTKENNLWLTRITQCIQNCPHWQGCTHCVWRYLALRTRSISEFTGVSYIVLFMITQRKLSRGDKTVILRFLTCDGIAMPNPVVSKCPVQRFMYIACVMTWRIWSRHSVRTSLSHSRRTSCRKTRYLRASSGGGKMCSPTKLSVSILAHILTLKRYFAARGRVP